MQAVLILIADWLDVHALPILARAKVPQKSAGSPLAFSTAQNVTSNLDPEIQRADHRQGGGGAGTDREPGPNSFVIKILTSKLFEDRILRGISC
jgi:hypothetical protein